MKNIHVLPTPNPSRLHFDGKLFLSTNYQLSKTINSIVEGRNIYITNDEEIKKGEYGLSSLGKVVKFTEDGIYNYSLWKKIILTTDQELIKDGVQSIPDEFLEWFVKNSSCEEVEVKEDECGWFVNGGKDIEYRKYNYIEIPKEEPNYNMKQEILAEMERLEEEPKQETLEEVCNKINFINPRERVAYYNGLKNGAKWQQEQDKNKYSEEDVREAFKQGQDNMEYSEMYGFDSKLTEQEWFEQFKKK